ncbi:hypothetical protein HQ403_00475 [Candidatus Kaiserbacteria bacterium]|nr:hypothetical protein [Candidatus Kaiserbacteria bacterium]
MLPRRVFLLPTLITLLITLVVISLFFIQRDPADELTSSLGKDPTFKELSVYFEDLAKEKGASYAFDVLGRVELPQNIDLHLLGHIVGDQLYIQEGIDGIKKCSQDFRNACSHSVVIGALIENGEGILPEVKNACHGAPGGVGAYTMCFHGFGHGVLAYNDYTLPDAVEFCKKVGTEEFYNREYVECVGGAVMEMIAGVHDRATWEEKSHIYFKESDPLYPCSADFIDDEVRGICYTYLTPHLFEAVGANLGKPTAYDFDKAFKLCSVLPEKDTLSRNACYGGFGKEFVVLAQNRDIRKIESMNEEQLRKVFSWCLLADTKEGVTQCMFSAVQSLYWGGENDPGAVTRFCSLIEESSYQGACFGEIIGAMSTYVNDSVYREEYCKKIPFQYRNQCKEILL